MQREDITKQRDQRPCFLGVPATKPSQRIVCPDTAQNRARSKQKHAELQHAVEPKMHWCVCSRRRRVARVPPEWNVTEAHCQRESRIAKRDREHMNREPEIIA